VQNNKNERGRLCQSEESNPSEPLVMNIEQQAGKIYLMNGPETPTDDARDFAPWIKFLGLPHPNNNCQIQIQKPKAFPFALVPPYQSHLSLWLSSSQLIGIQILQLFKVCSFSDLWIQV